MTNLVPLFARRRASRTAVDAADPAPTEARSAVPTVAPRPPALPGGDPLARRRVVTDDAADPDLRAVVGSAVLTGDPLTLMRHHARVSRVFGEDPTETIATAPVIHVTTSGVELVLCLGGAAWRTAAGGWLWWPLNGDPSRFALLVAAIRQCWPRGHGVVDPDPAHVTIPATIHALDRALIRHHWTGDAS
jgi:hypothetical protein